MGKTGKGRNRRKRPANTTTGKFRHFLSSGAETPTNPSLGPAQITKTQTCYHSTLNPTATTSLQMPPKITWRGLDGLRQ